jgi:HEAT repeat protein
LEDEAEEKLSGLPPVVRGLCRASDPEVRAMAARVLGQISTDPAADAELLRSLLDGEEHELVKASVIEATVLLGSRRGNGVPTFDEDAVAQALGDPSRAVRYRVARAVHGRVSTRLAPLVDQALQIDPAEQSTLVWPAEV